MLIDDTIITFENIHFGQVQSVDTFSNTTRIIRKGGSVELCITPIGIDLEIGDYVSFGRPTKGGQFSIIGRCPVKYTPDTVTAFEISSTGSSQWE